MGQGGSRPGGPASQARRGRAAAQHSEPGRAAATGGAGRPRGATAQNDAAPQDSQPMNEVLRQLFNR